MTSSKCRGVMMAEGPMVEGTMAFLIAGLLSLPWMPICLTTCLCGEDMEVLPPGLWRAVMKDLPPRGIQALERGDGTIALVWQNSGGHFCAMMSMATSARGLPTSPGPAALPALGSVAIYELLSSETLSPPTFIPTHKAH